MPPFSYTGNDLFVKSVLRAYAAAELARIRAQTALRIILGKGELPSGIKEAALSGLSKNACPLCMEAGKTVSPTVGEPIKLFCSKCGLDWLAGDAQQGKDADKTVKAVAEDQGGRGERKHQGDVEKKEKLSQELRKILAEMTSGLTKAGGIFDGLEAEMDRAAVKLGIDKKKIQDGKGN